MIEGIPVSTETPTGSGTTETEIFAFADGDFVVTEDVVRRRHVKIEVRQGEIQEIILSVRLPHGAAGIVHRESRRRPWPGKRRADYTCPAGCPGWEKRSR